MAIDTIYSMTFSAIKKLPSLTIAKPMKLYLIQVGYKGTNGRIEILEQDFEGETSEQALEMAKVYYSDRIRYRPLAEMIFSTPIEASSTRGGRGSVSIGGTVKGVRIVTGNNNVVSQHGKHNINIGTATGLHIGD